jgi:hypothetical protein
MGLTQLVKDTAHIAHACVDWPLDVDDGAGSVIRDDYIQPLVHLQHRSQGQQDWAHALAPQQQHSYGTLLDR